MAELGRTAVRVHGLTRGGYLDQVRGYCRRLWDTLMRLNIDELRIRRDRTGSSFRSAGADFNHRERAHHQSRRELSLLINSACTPKYLPSSPLTPAEQCPATAV
jgi:hypothetical protein